MKHFSTVRHQTYYCCCRGQSAEGSGVNVHAILTPSAHISDARDDPDPRSTGHANHQDRCNIVSTCASFPRIISIRPSPGSLGRSGSIAHQGDSVTLESHRRRLKVPGSSLRQSSEFTSRGSSSKIRVKLSVDQRSGVPHVGSKPCTADPRPE